MKRHHMIDPLYLLLWPDLLLLCPMQKGEAIGLSAKAYGITCAVLKFMF